MSDTPEPIDPRTLPAEPVACSLGTWTHSDVDAGGNVYLIETPTGATIAIRANGDLSAANIEADITNPAPAPTIRKQSARVVLDRLTTQERTALHAARQSSAELDAFVLKAVSEGAISEADPEIAAAVTALDAAGIIAANRWAALLA